MQDDPDSLARLAGIIVSSAWFFLLIVVLVRLNGKRTASNMNNFDWIVTVSIGSMAASGVLSASTSVLAATVAICAMFALQWITSWAVMKSTKVAQFVKPAPRILVHKGRVLDKEMLAERITEDELKAAMRQAGMTDPEDANWVIIETNGQLSVIPRQDVGVDEAWLLDGVLTNLPDDGDDDGDVDDSDDERGAPDDEKTG